MYRQGLSGPGLDRDQTDIDGPRWSRKFHLGMDCPDQSGPGPDLVQTVPGGKFILGCVDTVRGSHGGWAGGEVVGQHGLVSNPSFANVFSC